MDLPTCPLKKYRIARLVGRGAYGIVYEAHHPKKGKTAVKQINNDAQGMREIKMMQRIAAANAQSLRHTCQIYDWNTKDYDLWFAMEYFHTPLERYDPNFASPYAILSIGMASAKGLLEMWNADVVDDDVKPANLAMTEDGRLAHIDLGCARLRGERPSGYTEDFAAPELISGKASDTTSVYAWGRMMEYFAYGRTGIYPHYILSDLIPWVGLSFAKLVKDCCNEIPNHRPEPPELVRRMRDIRHQRRRCPRCADQFYMFADAVCPTCGKS